MKRKKALFSILFSILFFAGGVSKAYCLVETIAGIGAATGALSSLLNGVIDKVSDETKAILGQALQEANALESTLTTDLSQFENVTVADIERLTGNTLSQVDNTLQSSIADITRLEDKINAQVAGQIRDAVHMANVTWAKVAKDSAKLVLKIERGAAVIIDTSLVQVVKIITLVCAFIVLIIGVIVLIKRRTPGIIISSIGLVLIIFCLTPFFNSLVSNWSNIREAVTLDDSVDPPEILIIAPSSANFGETGTMAILGMNFLPKKDTSKLMLGTAQNALRQESRASIGPNKIDVPLDVFTKASGTYFIRIDRDDSQKSAIFSFYVSRPNEVPLAISFTIWQTGRWSAQSSGSLQVRELQDEHNAGNTTRSYQSIYTPPSPWRSTSFTKNELRSNNISVLTENLVGNSLKVNFNLTSGPFYDRWRGWYDADYAISLENSNLGDTRGMAEHGETTLYYDEETGSVSAVKSNRYASLGVASYELALGGTLSPIGAVSAAAGRLPAKLSEILKGSLIRSDSAFLDPRAFRRVGLLAGSNRAPLFTQHVAVPHAPVRDAVPLLDNLRHAFAVPRQSQIVFSLGTAPAAPGFSPQQTWYDVAVVFGSMSKAFSGKTGQTPVFNDEGKIVMTFDTGSDGTLFMTWMND
jgi:hypothetical protein